MTVGSLLMKSVLISLEKSILVPLGLIAAASAADAAIQKKIFRSVTTALIISYKEMDYMMKIVMSLEDAGLLMKGITKTTKNESKEQKAGHGF